MPNATALLRTLLRTCFAIALVAVVLLIAAFNTPKSRPDPNVSSSAPAPPPLIAKKIIPGPVKFERQRPNRRLVKGSFKITDGGAGSIPSPGTGGACLIADLNQFNMPTRVNGQTRTCTQADECKVGLPDNYFGYCADPGDGTPQKICWTRPGPDTLLCDKSPFHNPPKVWPVDVDNQLTPVDISGPGFIPQLRGHVRWRIVACLNGNPPGCAMPGVSDNGPERLEVYGTPYESDWTP